MSNEAGNTAAQVAFIGTVRTVVGHAIGEEEHREFADGLRQRIATRFPSEAQRNLYSKAVDAYLEFRTGFDRYDSMVNISRPGLEDVTIVDVDGTLTADFTIRPYARRGVVPELSADAVAQITATVQQKHPDFEAKYVPETNSVFCTYTASVMSLSEG